MRQGRWSVDPDGHHLQVDGKRALLIGDTAWELVHSSTIDVAREYIEIRAKQGFNMLLVHAVPEIGGFEQITPNGHFAFDDGDVTKPNPGYFDYISDVLDVMAEYRLTMGFCAFWGRWWKHPYRGDKLPKFHPGNAEGYGRFLGERYRDRDIIWFVGGDDVPVTEDHFLTNDLVIKGLIDTGATQIRSFHPNGPWASSDTHADHEWMDFNCYQSGHAGWATPSYQYVEQDYYREPLKPVLDVESNYEDFPVMTPEWTPLPSHRFDDTDIRRAAYQALLAGAAGHVYGCNDTWQLLDPERTTGLNKPIFEGRTHWREGIWRAGAQQMTHVSKFANDVGLLDMVPDQTLLPFEVGTGLRHRRAMLGTDSMIAYVPWGRQLTVDLSRWGQQQVSARWFDPRTGSWAEPETYASGPRLVIPHPFPDDDGLIEIRKV